MNNLQIFQNEEFGQVRIIEKDGEFWFVGKDVADALDYSNSSKAVIQHVDSEDRQKQMISHSQNGNMVKTQTTLINESGLYSLVLSSKMPKAKKFKRWVTFEVLPTIRKKGIYATNAAIDKILHNPDFGIQLLQELKKERKQKRELELTNKRQQQIIGELKPKADYTDKILKSKDLVTITQIAKDYGMSGRAMNELLHDLGVQYKQSGQWLLYAEHQGKGYTQSQTYEYTRNDGSAGTNMLTKWTQKGRLFLYELLKDNGILPVIEREE